MKRRRIRILPRFIIPALAGFGILMAAGCGSVDVDPFLGSERYFTLYGSFDMDFLVQHLRVVPIDRDIGTVDSTIDAAVTATDLSNGQTWIWRDSVFTFTDGSIGHVFTSRFRIQAGRTYRIEVTRSDGAMTWVETTVPEQPRAIMGEADITSPPDLAFPTGTQKILWTGLMTEPHRVDVSYRFVEQDDMPFIDLDIPYDTKSSSPDISNGWEITVHYTADYAFLKKEYIRDNPWRFVGALMRVQVLADDWVPPGGVWDREVLSQPGTLSNVHNGFGYVGSAGRFSVEWIP